MSGLECINARFKLLILRRKLRDIFRSDGTKALPENK